MPINLNLATMRITDVIELHRARINLRQTHQAIAASALQAKPALLGGLDQADDVILDVIRKCAKLAVRYGGKGLFKRQRVPAELVELLMELAPEEAAKFAPAESVVVEPGRKFITAGRNHDGDE